MPVFIAALFTIIRTWLDVLDNLDVHWQMDKAVLHVYNGILLIHKKEQIWGSCSEVNEARTCYTEWSKSEREKQILYINTHIYGI